MVIFFFKDKPEECPTFSQAVFRRREFNFKNEYDALMSDIIFKKGLAICVVLLTYCYCSPYHFYWYQFDQTSDIYDYYAPGCFLGGVLLFTALLLRNFDFKNLLIVNIAANLVCMLLVEVAYLIKNDILIYIGYIP